ncbi:MAG TPA: pyridoxal phosphate-dependent aminotransferase [Sphingopyxis sp.]|nr:pyridoxal phosphate-dependent aminotransferase [Sphingopyxis sp.]
MRYARLPIEVESPEEFGYGNIRNNLAESSISDRKLSDLGLTVPDLTLLYTEHRGGTALRTLIARDGEGLTADDVLVTTGAAGALFIIATALLAPGDHIVVVRPNYGLNLETPRAIGCAISHIDLTFDDGFRIDVDALAAAVTPKTRIISITHPHNPSGILSDEAELRRLAEIAADNGAFLVVDETYRELCFGTLTPLAATLGDHVISVSSLSKAYGIPGTRMGWLTVRNPALHEIFLAAKEQIAICGSVIDEWIAEQVLRRKDAILAETLAEMRVRRDLVRDWIAGEDRLEWNEPSGGVVGFLRMCGEPQGGTGAFYQRLLDAHGTYVAPGHWFDLPDSYFRLGYGWPSRSEVEAGRVAISASLRGA